MSARDSRGQVTVEFALTLPLVAVLVCAILDLSFVFFQQHTVNTACRIAARRGAVGATDSEIVSIVQGFSSGLDIPAGRIAVTVTTEGGLALAAGTRTSGCELNVRVQHDLKFLTPLQSVFRGVGVTSLRSESQFLIE